MRNAPRHLSSKTRAWWKRYVKENNFRESQLQLLTLAGEAWDRSAQARCILDEQGLTYMDRFGQPRARPEIDIENKAKLTFEKLIKNLARETADLPDWFKNAKLK